MPVEIRQIQFKAQEALLAITEYYRRRNMSLPIGTALSVVFSEDPSVSAVLNIQTAERGMESVAIPSEVLGAALILFCINRKIPLPAESDKRLQKIGEDAVALFVVKRIR